MATTKVEERDIAYYKVTTGGGTTAYTAAYPGFTLVDGARITVKMNATNTGSSTLNVNGLGAKTIKNSAGANLSSGDLVINSIYEFVYDLAQDFFFLIKVEINTSSEVVGSATSSLGFLLVLDPATGDAGVSDVGNGVWQTTYNGYVWIFYGVNHQNGAGSRNMWIFVRRYEIATGIITNMSNVFSGYAGGGLSGMVSVYHDGNTVYFNLNTTPFQHNTYNMDTDGFTTLNAGHVTTGTEKFNGTPFSNGGQTYTPTVYRDAGVQTRITVGYLVVT